MAISERFPAVSTGYGVALVWSRMIFHPSAVFSQTSEKMPLDVAATRSGARQMELSRHDGVVRA